MADQETEKVDIEEIRRLDERALRRVRRFVAAFLQLQAYEREFDADESCTPGKNDGQPSTAVPELFEALEKENGSK